MHDDGLAYVKEADWPTMYGPDGSPTGEPVYKMAGGMAGVPEEHLDATIESAEEQACWAEISATSDADRAVFDFAERADMSWSEGEVDLFYKRQTVYEEMHNECEALG